MSNATQAIAERYEVDCYFCGKRFDAASAEWCACLGASPTLKCPSCSRCFCRSTAIHIHRFWKHAPAILWSERKRRLTPHEETRSTVEASDGQPLVLFVDDSSLMQSIVTRELRGFGFAVITASTAPEAIEFARKYSPAIVVTDALMPRVDGRELCRTIKHDHELSGMKVIIVSAVYKDARYKYEAMRDFAADDYLVKPFTTEELAKIIVKHLRRDRKRSRTALNAGA